MIPNENIEECIDSLVENGWYSCSSFLPEELLCALRTELQELFHNGEFKKASIGAHSQIHTETRGDFIHWIEQEIMSPAMTNYYSEVHAIRDLLNRSLYCGIQRFEAHYALYPEGTVYKRHVDNFRNTNNRLFSCILYLNEEWTVDDGGQLRLYHSKDTYTDILPTAGTFAIFRSESMEHEVLPARRSRMSITGWLRRDS